MENRTITLDEDTAERLEEFVEAVVAKRQDVPDETGILQSRLPDGSGVAVLTLGELRAVLAALK